MQMQNANVANHRGCENKLNLRHCLGKSVRKNLCQWWLHNPEAGRLQCQCEKEQLSHLLKSLSNSHNSAIVWQIFYSDRNILVSPWKKNSNSVGQVVKSVKGLSGNIFPKEVLWVITFLMGAFTKSPLLQERLGLAQMDECSLK